MTNIKAKNDTKATNTKISRQRVNELVIERLETLAKKQRHRMPVRPRSVAVSAASLAVLARLEGALAKREAHRVKQPLSTQARTLVESICARACSHKRPSLDKEMAWAGCRRQVQRDGIALDFLPARTRQTGPCLRCLDRAEARLLRLVQAWALREAQRETEARREQDGC